MSGSVSVIAGVANAVASASASSYSCCSSSSSSSGVCSLAAGKKVLRSRVRSDLRSLSASCLSNSSARITHNFLNSPFFSLFTNYCFYVSMPHEFQSSSLLSSLFAAHKKLFLPRCWPIKDGAKMEFFEAFSQQDINEWPMNAWKIREPPLSTEGSCRRMLVNDPPAFALLDVVIVPGVAFDLRGGRLGNGGGYYDRWLTRVHEARKAWNDKLVDSSKKVRAMPWLVACALPQQLVDSVPLEDGKDWRVDAIITEEKCIAISDMSSITHPTASSNKIKD